MLKANKKLIKHIHKHQLSYTNKHNAVPQYNKCNQVPPSLSSKDRFIKEPMDFTCCEEVGLRISFNVLTVDPYRKTSGKAVTNCTI